MIAQDARWVADALLSTQSAGKASGVLPFALMGHSARIVYEGSVAIRSSNIDMGLPELAGLLEDRYAGVVARARHAGKFLDDSKKAFEDLLGEMVEFLDLHHAEFSGNAVWFARRFESDLGLFSVPSGRIVASTIPVQFRAGVQSMVKLSDLGQLLFEIAEEQGRVLLVLASADGDSTPPGPTVGYAPLGRVAAKDRKAVKYLADRYDPAFPTETKLLLLMVEGEVNTTDLVLPLTEPGHEEAVFRGRTVSLFHSLRAVKEILSAYPSAEAVATNTMRSLIDEQPTRRLLEDDGIRKVRNRCMHYEIRDSMLSLVPELPMFGIVESLYPGRTFDDLNEEVRAMASRLGETMNNWRT